jgi:hypothetical protein
MGYLLPGAGFPELFIFPETMSNEDTPLQLGPTPHPTSSGGSPTPKRMLAMPLDGWGPSNGCIGP